MQRLSRQTNLALHTNISKRNFIRNIAETSQMGVVIGHGTQVNSKSFNVPNNVHVVFLSDPGYSLSANIVDENFTRMVQDIRILRDFIRGTISDDKIPNQLRQRNWKWWNHIYQPRAKCPNLNMSIFDRNSEWIDNICGLWYAGATGRSIRGVPGSNIHGRKLYGKKLNLSAICRVASIDTRNHGGCILFVNSCRIPGEQIIGYQQNIWYPEAGMGLRTAYTRNAVGRQNYPLPSSRVINRVRNLEQTATRLVTRKRKMTGVTSRNTRPRLTTSNNNNSNNIQRLRTRISNFRNMINTISNANMNLAQARAHFPNFFRGMNNATSHSVVRNLKANNNVKNNMSEILRYNSKDDIMTYKVNSGPIAHRIVARIRNMTM